MSDKLRKALIYFRPLGAYWTAADPEEILVVSSGPEGRFPLRLFQRVEEGHYTSFDAEGLPVRIAPDGGRQYHNYSTLCSYALANWEKYQLTGDRSFAEILERTASYFLRTGEVLADGTLLLWDEYRHTLSSIYQGEAMSVFVRAWQYSRNERFCDAAKGCVLPLTRKVGEGGVAQTIAANGAVWYEERCWPPVRHILNGMNYALWGLRDVALATGDPLAKELLDQGLDSVERSLPLYDTGYWSRYWVAEDALNYVASMMYHNLHIVQLTVLARQTGRKSFQAYADRFRDYAGRFPNRMRAGMTLSCNKTVLSREIRSEGAGEGAYRS